MKKLIIINSILLILVLTIFVLGYYFINYPGNFNLVKTIKEAEWKPLSVIISAIFIGSVALAFLPIKKYSFAKRFLTILAGLNILLLAFLILNGLDFFFRNKSAFDELSSEYKKKAEGDIKSGLITIEYSGGYELPADEKIQKMNTELDSLNRTYGITYRNSDCVVSTVLTKAQEEYIKYTKPYLDKRNGPGWELRLKKQREQIRNRYPKMADLP